MIDIAGISLADAKAEKDRTKLQAMKDKIVAYINSKIQSGGGMANLIPLVAGVSTGATLISGKGGIEGSGRLAQAGQNLASTVRSLTAKKDDKTGERGAFFNPNDSNSVDSMFVGATSWLPEDVKLAGEILVEINKNLKSTVRTDEYSESAGKLVEEFFNLDKSLDYAEKEGNVNEAKRLEEAGRGIITRLSNDTELLAAFKDKAKDKLGMGGKK